MYTWGKGFRLGRVHEAINDKRVLAVFKESGQGSPGNGLPVREVGRAFLEDIVFLQPPPHGQVPALGRDLLDVVSQLNFLGDQFIPFRPVCL